MTGGRSDHRRRDTTRQSVPGDAELAESIEHRHDAGGFIADVPAWNEEDPLP